MSKQVPLLDFSVVESTIEKSGKDAHLLLGNGFNNALCVKTRYEDIFNEMLEIYPDYRELKEYMISVDYDLEKFLEVIESHIDQGEEDISNLNKSSFLKKFTENRIKMDFMKAASSIVNREIKNIYQDKLEPFYLFIKNFQNYFTLNYDPLLYLLFMQLQPKERKDILVIPPSAKEFPTLATNIQKEIYDKVKEARDEGFQVITISNDSIQENLKDLTKKRFETTVKSYLKRENRGYKKDDIDKVIDVLWEEGKEKLYFETYDGFKKRQGTISYVPDKEQNVFYLHGAFHIRKGKDKIIKITQKRNSSFLQRLAETIHSEDQDIVCILSGTTDNKKEQIENNKYLKRCFSELGSIGGSIVILGCSVSDNDKHIFEQIQKSDVDSVYIGTSPGEVDRVSSNANEWLQGKEVRYFDFNTCHKFEKSKAVPPSETK